MKRLVILIALFAAFVSQGQPDVLSVSRNSVRLPWNMGDLFMVDGGLYVCSGDLLMSLSRSGDYVYSLKPDTSLQGSDKNLRYVVRNLRDSMFYYTVGDVTPQLYVALDEAGALGKKGKRVSLSNWNDGVGHPIFSRDGNLMVFSSVSGGGLGNFDLWCSVWNGKTWSTPINLGGRINTSGCEVRPFFYKDYLVYASDGREKPLGGYDLYAVRIQQDTSRDKLIFDNYSVQQLPEPINSVADDWGLVSDGQAQGYWISFRNGAAELYGYEGALDGVAFCGHVTDSIRVPLANAEVLVKRNGRLVGMAHTDVKGAFDIFVQPGFKYQLEVSKPGYFKYCQELFAHRGNEENLIFKMRHNVTLKSLPFYQPINYTDIFAKGVAVDISPEGEARLASLVQFLRDNAPVKMMVSLYCDQTSDSTFNTLLCSRRLDALRCYFESVLPPSVHVYYSNANEMMEQESQASETHSLTVVVSDLY